MGRVVRREQCPSCAAQGRDNSGDNLAIYDDGGGKCFSCNYVLPANQKNKPKVEKSMSEVSSGLEVYHTLPCRSVHGVDASICEYYGVRVSVDVITGAIDEVYYPYYDTDRKLVACKVRKLQTKAFRWIGNPKKATLFGQQLLPAGGSKGILIIQEGEKDVLAATAMILKCGQRYPVVSIKDGANDADKTDQGVIDNMETLSKFSNIVLAFDNDRPGQRTQKATAEFLCQESKVRLLHYPEGFKDAADLLDKQKHLVYMNLLKDSAVFTPESIVDGTQIKLEDLLSPLPRGAKIPFKGLQEKMQGLRKGELTTITAAPGAGKSTLSRELAYDLAKNGFSVANIFLEETLEKTAQSLIALDNNVPLPRLRADPTCISREAYESSYKNLVANGRTFFFRHFGSMQSESLLSKMRYYAHSCKVDYIFLDHLSMVVSGSDETNDERKLLDLICTNLAKFCTETGVGVIMVVHLRKKGTNEKENSIITLDDLRGSGGIAQLSFNVIAAMRDTTAMEADKANVVQLWVLKNREWGYTGPAGKLVYNSNTGRLQEIESPF